jgi:putative glutamine amidotransferase
MRPLIGIPCLPGKRLDNARPIYGNNRAYVHAVENAGGVPVLIPILDDLTGLRALLPRLDGLLLSGGFDIQPQLYGEEPHPLLGDVVPELDALELALARWAIEEDMPTLGICRGLQMINTALGGTLYQDLGDQYASSVFHPNWDKPRNTLSHRIYVEEGSLMEQVLGSREVWVNSLHHQAVKLSGNGVYSSGHAEDGVVELLEVPNQRFMLAVQGHPEELYQDNPAWARLFRAFIEACAAAPQVVHHIEIVEEAVGIGVGRM